MSPPTSIAASALGGVGETGEKRREASGSTAPGAPAVVAGRSDRERLGDLFDIHHRRLFQLACRLTSDREAARDLVQETFLRAARQVGRVPRDAAHGEGWLVQTMVNLCRDHHRRAAVRARAASSLATAALHASREAPAERGAESRVVAQATVRAALAQLSPRRRAVVVLHELEELPVSAVARLLGVAEVTVRWHLMAARRHLAALLVAPRCSGAVRVAGGDRP